MTERQHEYKIVDHSRDKVLGNVWWDGKKIQYDNDVVSTIVKEAITAGKTHEDGPEFLKELPRHFNGTYMAAESVE